MEDKKSPPVLPRISVSSIRFSDEQEVVFSPSDVVLVVGPNNGGKSSLLRGVREFARDNPPRNFVVSAVKVDRHGSDEDLRAWLAPMQRGEASIDPDKQLYVVGGNGYQFSTLKYQWNHEQGLPDALGSAFVFLLSAEERLKLCDPPRNFSVLHQIPVHPIQSLLQNDKLEYKVSEKVARAFGVEEVAPLV